MSTTFQPGDRVTTPWRAPVVGEILQGPRTQGGERWWLVRWPDLPGDLVRELVLILHEEPGQ